MSALVFGTYLLGIHNNYKWVWALQESTTAFDISTTQTITRRLGVGTNELGTPIQELHPYGITFNGDGTKLYIS